MLFESASIEIVAIGAFQDFKKFHQGNCNMQARLDLLNGKHEKHFTVFDGSKLKLRFQEIANRTKKGIFSMKLQSKSCKKIIKVQRKQKLTGKTNILEGSDK